MIRRLYWIASQQVGIDLRRIIHFIPGFFRYFQDWIAVRSWGEPLEFVPCVHDSRDEGGNARTEYFWQDLIAAQLIREASPVRHLDVGSRLDGFVAHVAAFRDLDVCDIRPVSVQIPGVRFVQRDLMSPQEDNQRYDSVSCLHALEHFGLGRYGDPLTQNGYVLGLQNLARLLEEQGKLYLSVPLGQSRIEFNANRVFAPQTILDLAAKYGLELQRFFHFSDPDTGMREVTNPDWAEIGRMRYSLGLFVFVKAVLK